MESTKFPIVIKKKNGVMLGISMLEVIVGIIFGIIEGGLKSIPMWIFIFVAIITALSVLVEYNQDILIKENKVEFYKNNDLIKAIKYSSIKAIIIDKGNEQKTKKKDFFTIVIGSNDIKTNKNKNSKEEKYLVNPMNYSARDLITLRNIIVSKNSFVKVSDDVKKFFNEK